jgi:glyoxylase-like metal-dependent hydrolase (beta-lactamase superfamily II)
MSLFTQKKISEHVSRIRTPLGVCMYLVQGTEKSLLIDTGMGVGSLKTYLKTINVPFCDLVLTHGHCDHAGGAGEFEHAYLNEEDWELEKTHASLEHRIYDVYHAPFGVPEGIKESDFLPQRTTPFIPLFEDTWFDLGGVSLHCISVPGHTHGCMVPLIKEDRIAIFGDAIGEGTLLHFPESTSVEEYQRGLIHAEEYIDEFDTVLRFHGSCVSDKKILLDMIALTEDIIEGRDAAVPVNFMGIPALMGRPKEHPGKEGNLIYNPEKIRIKK